MSLKNRDRAELIRLKMKMEIIRTICPMIMILIQLFIIIELYWKCSTWNTSNPNENHSYLGFFLSRIFQMQMRIIRKWEWIANGNDSQMRMTRIWLICFFPKNRRACASAKVKYYFECCPEMCDRFGNQGHSLYFGAGAPVQKRSGFAKVLPAPIIQCQNELVKSFLWLWANLRNYIPIG